MARMLYVLAIPELSDDDRLWIAAIRAKHDATTAASVGPHFTLVFGCDGVDEQAVLAHVRDVALDVAAIDFVCRRAVVGTDHADPSGYAFLVPDEGNSALFRLYDRLHTGPLEATLRLDVPFVPHMTVGRFGSLLEAKTVCDSLSRHPIAVRGSIAAISVVAAASGALEVLARYPLASPGP